MDAKKLREIERMYNAGQPVKKIAAQLHMSMANLYNYIGVLAEKKLVVLRDRGAVSARPNMLVIHKSRANKQMKLIEYQPLGKPVTIMELTNNTCRWPCAGSMFCGEEVSNRGYCKEHYRVSIQDKGNDDGNTIIS